MKGNIYDFYILHQRKYKENSLLITVFSKEFGKLSAIVRVSKKQQNLYQPLVALSGEFSLPKASEGLSKVYNIEFVESFYNKSYIVLMSLQYINELMYALLSHSHDEVKLFNKYDFILKNITKDNYLYMLRMFELELLNSLGHSICVDQDVGGEAITTDKSYGVLPSIGFKIFDGVGAIKGSTIKKIYEPMFLWSEDDLKNITRIIRININACLSGRELKSRKLIREYLSLKD